MRLFGRIEGEEGAAYAMMAGGRHVAACSRVFNHSLSLYDSLSRSSRIGLGKERVCRDAHVLSASSRGLSVGRLDQGARAKLKIIKLLNLHPL